MDEPHDRLVTALERAGVPALPIVVPTPWDIGSVNAFLFPDDPVTFIDSGVDTPEGRAGLTEALGAQGLSPADVRRVLVTHAHTDHFGGAIWLQRESDCEVLVHEADRAMVTDPNWQETERSIFPALGFSAEEVEKFFANDSYEGGSRTSRRCRTERSSPWAGRVCVSSTIPATHPVTCGSSSKARARSSSGITFWRTIRPTPVSTATTVTRRDELSSWRCTTRACAS
jgi:hypothetical protein